MNVDTLMAILNYSSTNGNNIGEYTKQPNYNEKKILQSTLENNFIKTYSNTKQASIETKILRTSIVNCLQNRTKTAGGYKWKYV